MIEIANVKPRQRSSVVKKLFRPGNSRPETTYLGCNCSYQLEAKFKLGVKVVQGVPPNIPF